MLVFSTDATLLSIQMHKVLCRAEQAVANNSVFSNNIVTY